MLRTDRDVAHYVHQALDGDGFAYDERAIVDELIESFPIVGAAPSLSFDEIPAEEFWAIVNRHEAVGVVAEGDDLTPDGQFGRIRVGADDVLEYAADDDEGRARAGIRKALEDHGWRVVNESADLDGWRGRVVRSR